MANDKVMVEMTTEEAEQLKAFREEKAKREAEEKHAQEVKTYKDLVDEAVNDTVPEAEDVSRMLEQRKAGIFERFHSIIAMKEELYKGSKSMAKEGRFTDSFTNKAGTARVTLGFNTNDAYDDTYTAQSAERAPSGEHGKRERRSYVHRGNEDHPRRLPSGTHQAVCQGGSQRRKRQVPNHQSEHDKLLSYG